MPEMLRYFGKTFTVKAQVARACDTFEYQGVRRLPRTVILDDLRCDGMGHDGCQAGCRLYWKEAWLRSASREETHGDVNADDAFARLEHVVSANVRATTSTVEEPTYRCQATELLRASEPVPWRSIRSLVGELTSGNVGLWTFVRVMTRVAVEKVGRRLHLVSSSPVPFRPSELGCKSGSAPSPIGLRPGELVQVRPRAEIAKTLGENGKNRGLWFDREMVSYCGTTARVKAKVERFIDERTGRFVELASDAYILDNVVCHSYQSDGRWFCPRAIYPYWRECWLDRLQDDPAKPSPVTDVEDHATSTR
jgi:hypothetical protein